MIDGRDRGSIPGTGVVEVTRLGAGSRTVSLTGIAPNCAVTGTSERTVTVVVGVIALVEFVVACTATRPEPPPGSEILAFHSHGDIYVADADGSHLGRLTADDAPSSSNAGAAWSPDGRRLAFYKLEGAGKAGIYVIDADGANLTRLSPDGAYDLEPTWSPDGSRIAFATGADITTEGHIFVMNPDGTNRVQLTTNRHSNSSPAWSPDGRRIAYATRRDAISADLAIFLMNADGTNRKRLTNDEESESAPAWSPDGNRIVFKRGREIASVNADGSDLKVLTPPLSGFGGSREPAWSPDGRKIAFTRSTECRIDRYGDPSCQIGIWIMDFDGRQLHRLSLGVGRETGPRWRP